MSSMRIMEMPQLNQRSLKVEHSKLETEADLSKIRSSKNERTLESFTEAIRLNPEDAFAYYSRGAAYYDLGRHDLAMQDYDAVIRLDPQNGRAYTGRGATYHSFRQYERAIQDYDEAIRLDPRDALAYGNRGNA